LLADEIRVTADGGGKAPAFRKVLQGCDRVARLYAGLRRKFGERMTYRIAEINGELGPYVIRRRQTRIGYVVCQRRDAGF
jgi:RNA polymerase sigma-70 factor, ECF subfamily